MEAIFTILFILFLIYLLVTYWPLFLVGLIILIIILIAVAVSRSREQTVKYEELTENVNYKIGAEVGSLFYYEVKDYCYKHHMTISDLIRKSVRAYMNSNK